VAGALGKVKPEEIAAFEALREFCIQRRHELRLSQEDVARKGGISSGTIATLEAGTRPSLPRQKTIEGLARGLDVPYWLLDRLVRGVPRETQIGEADLNVILSEADPMLRAMLVEIALAPEEKKTALKAALAAALAMTRPNQRP
jgi:transcriptional regulator with XRE-family HTH domain